MTSNKSLARTISSAYQTTYTQLVRFFQKRLDNQNDANDLSQDVFAQWLKRNEQTPVQETRAFLFKIANNVLIDHWRRNQTRGRAHAEHEDLDYSQHGVSDIDDPALLLEHRERLQCLYQAIDSLPQRQREAFVLYRFEGLSQSEIAEQMEISVSMVEKHIAQALLHCKRHVDNI